jgi:hypothetical protein
MIEMLRSLQQLRNELELDLMYCTTRDSHIRLTQRIATLDLIILQSSSERDTAALCDTVLP